MYSRFGLLYRKLGTDTEISFWAIKRLGICIIGFMILVPLLGTYKHTVYQDISKMVRPSVRYILKSNMIHSNWKNDGLLRYLENHRWVGSNLSKEKIKWQKAKENIIWRKVFYSFQGQVKVRKRIEGYNTFSPMEDRINERIPFPSLYERLLRQFSIGPLIISHTCNQ